jgi:hypothetical protein
MVSAMSAFPAAATTEYELERQCAHPDATTAAAPKAAARKPASDKHKSWLEKRGYRDSFGHDDEQGKANPNEDALIDDIK